MSKLSFRARALDASKPMPIFMAEELPDLPDYSAINRAVPQMPSGMEKEEECEHHLQRAICTGIIIPTPEVSELPDKEAYDKLYPADYKQPRQLIHMQPFTMEQDITDYDIDSEDERWLVSQAQKRLELDVGKFEDMMDRLEKSSGQTVVTLNEAKALLKEDDDLIIAVYDYWLNKRLRLQHPLILTVKTEQRAGTAANNPYLAFRRRTEKMQTRKNRKNDETSYEKMLKLKRDLCRTVTLLELVKRREKMKREYVNLTIEVFEKRYQTKDFSGAIVAEVAALKSSRPAFTPIFHNHYANQGWSNKAILKDEIIPRKEKRQYKKRKHKSLAHSRAAGMAGGAMEGALSSDEETTVPQVSPEPEEVEDEGQFVFRRNKLCSYHMPISNEGNWPWCSKQENGLADKRYRYTLTSLSNPRRRCIGFARRRIGRGGRIILDRAHHDLDDFWRTADFTIYEPDNTMTTQTPIKTEEIADNSRLYPNCSYGGDYGQCDDRLRTTSGSDCGVVTVKREPVDEVKVEGGGEESMEKMAVDVVGVGPKEEEDNMVEFLKIVRKEWLHFRPKTPPPDYEPPCHLLPADDPPFFIPTTSTPFSLELQVLDEKPSAMLDLSSFVTTPFHLDDDDDLEMDILEQPDEEVPITDTRQSSTDRNVQITTIGVANTAPNTLNSSVSNFEIDVVEDNNSDDDGGDEKRTICCSRFKVLDKCVLTTTTSNNKKHSVVSSTLTSPKLNLNSVNVSTSPPDGRQQQQQQQRQNDCFVNTTTTNSANGLLLTQFGIDGSSSPSCKMKFSNKIPYAYNTSSGVEYSNNAAAAAAPASGGTLSLRTSAHTLTLSRHSANILEIPLSNDSEKVPNNKVVNSQCTEGNTPSPNNKNKTIVRKNNIVMEVT